MTSRNPEAGSEADSERDLEGRGLERFLFFKIYRWVLAPLGYLLILLVSWSPWGPKKIRQMIQDRRVNSNSTTNANAAKVTKAIRTVWVHAASGEIEYAKPVLRALRKEREGESLQPLRMVLTYTSPSAKKLMGDLESLVDEVYPLPWDTAWHMGAFFQKIRPQVLLIARTDLWPEMLYRAHQMDVKTLLFSVTFSKQVEKSDWKKKGGQEKLKGLSGRLGIWGIWWRSLFSPPISLLPYLGLDGIFFVSEEDKKQFQIALGEETGKVQTLKVVGDTRFDQVVYRLQHPKGQNQIWWPQAQIWWQRAKVWTQKRGEGGVFVLGSTWPQDEEALWPLLAQWLSRGLGPLIWAPHEVGEDHLLAIEARLSQLGLRGQRLSSISTPDSRDSIKSGEEPFSATTPPVLLVDLVGFLAEFYSWGDWAFVGGSFKDKVHSVMEPLAAGTPVLLGPHYTNNREAVEFQKISLPSSGLPAVRIWREPPCFDSRTRGKTPFDFRSPPTPEDRQFLMEKVQRAGRNSTECVVQWTQAHLSKK